MKNRYSTAILLPSRRAETGAIFLAGGGLRVCSGPRRVVETVGWAAPAGRPHRPRPPSWRRVVVGPGGDRHGIAAIASMRTAVRSCYQTAFGGAVTARRAGPSCATAAAPIVRCGVWCAGPARDVSMRKPAERQLVGQSIGTAWSSGDRHRLRVVITRLSVLMAIPRVGGPRLFRLCDNPRVTPLNSGTVGVGVRATVRRR